MDYDPFAELLQSRTKQNYFYLSSLIKTSCLTRGNRLSLSSASHKKAIGRRGFVVASPIEWNRLPQSVRSQQTITGFRSQLKTYLFRLAYPPP